MSKSGGFGFLFHATSWDTLDLIFDNVPPKYQIDEQLLWNTPPFIGSPIYENDQVIGANIVMPVPIELWIQRPTMIKELRKKQLFPALQLAQQCGLNMVALGASTPYACNYGRLPRPIDTPSITTGHAATAAMLKKWAISSCQKTDLVFNNISLAVFGAAGRLGKAVSHYISHGMSPKEIVLIDLPDKVNSLKHLATDIQNQPSQNKTKVSVVGLVKNQPLPRFDGAILVSNNSVPYLDADNLRQARFWIDDSHPRAASIVAEESTRKETLYIECYASGPKGLNTDAAFKLPSTNDCYTCFAEGYIAWKEKITSDYITGIPEVSKIINVASLLDKYNFTTGSFFTKNGKIIK